jgi:hypothetical protein
MTGVLGLTLLLVIVAVALRLLFSGHLKPALYGIGLVLAVGCFAPVLIPALLPTFLHGLVIVLAVLGLLAVLLFVVHLIVDAI